MPRSLTPNERIKVSLSYGVMPDWKTFHHNFHAPDEDGRIIESYSMKLVGSDVIPRITREGYSYFTDRELYAFVKKLSKKWFSGSRYSEQAGDLASSILYTLGIEWI